MTEQTLDQVARKPGRRVLVRRIVLMLVIAAILGSGLAAFTVVGPLGGGTAYANKPVYYCNRGTETNPDIIGPTDVKSARIFERTYNYDCYAVHNH
jgi:hypothetical protein